MFSQTRPHYFLLLALAVPRSVLADPTQADEAQEERIKKYHDAVLVLESAVDTSRWMDCMKVLRGGFPESRQVLVDATRSSSARARAFAIRTLGELGDAEKDLETVRHGLKDRTAAVRLVAVVATGKFGSEGRRAVCSHLKSEKDVKVRILAVKVLGDAGSLNDVPALVQLMREEQDQQVLASFFKALEVLSGKKLRTVEAWEAYATECIDREQMELFLERYRANPAAR